MCTNLVDHISSHLRLETLTTMDSGNVVIAGFRKMFKAGGKTEE